MLSADAEIQIVVAPAASAQTALPHTLDVGVLESITEGLGLSLALNA